MTGKSECHARRIVRECPRRDERLGAPATWRRDTRKSPGIGRGGEYARPSSRAPARGLECARWRWPLRIAGVRLRNLVAPQILASGVAKRYGHRLSRTTQPIAALGARGDHAGEELYCGASLKAAWSGWAWRSGRAARGCPPRGRRGPRRSVMRASYLMYGDAEYQLSVADHEPCSRGPAMTAPLPLDGIKWSRSLSPRRSVAGEDPRPPRAQNVVKVERPEGDRRALGSAVHLGGGPTFHAVNMNKRSIVLDLKDPKPSRGSRLYRRGRRGRQNLRPRRHRGAGPRCRALLALNPRLVFCSCGPSATAVPGGSRPATSPWCRHSRGSSA
jgi:hypothetical protein